MEIFLLRSYNDCLATTRSFICYFWSRFNQWFSYRDLDYGTMCCELCREESQLSFEASQTLLAGVMRALVCLIIAVTTVLAQPAVAQGANTTLPLTYPGQVLQGYDNQTCPPEERLERVRNEVESATRRLL